MWTKLQEYGKKTYPDRIPGVQRLPFGMYLKRGYRTRSEEGFATQFVGYSTNIPVPTVVDTLEFGKEVLIVLTEIPGESLIDLMYDMSEEQLVDIGKQLSGYLSQLRTLCPPDDKICAFMGTPIRDLRISMGQYPFGPFPSISAFHDFLIKRGCLEIPDEQLQDTLQRINQSHSRQHRITFTHGDMHPGNIIVGHGNKITGIIDWEGAGWFPEYW